MNGPKLLDPNDYDDVVDVSDIIRKKASLNRRPQIGIVCGSGLNHLAREIKHSTVLPYSQIPGIPKPTVSGHEGNLVFGQLEGKEVVCMQGRIHPYEGYPLSLCTFPIRVMKELGITILILTNAVGALNKEFRVGDPMVIKDQIFLPGFSGKSPLSGVNDDRLGLRFPSTNNIYDKTLRKLAKAVAVEQRLTLREGVYVMAGGPQFETPAENRFLRTLGADAVGMSVCHEAIVAKHSGLKILGISLVTNMSEFDSEADEVDSLHKEVLDTGRENAAMASKLVRGILARLET